MNGEKIDILTKNPFHKRKIALQCVLQGPSLKGAVGKPKRTMKINYCCIIVKARIHAVVNTQLTADKEL